MMDSLQEGAREGSPFIEAGTEGNDLNVRDFLARLLTFDPAERPTSAVALEHAYVEPFHDPAAEKVASGIVHAAGLRDGETYDDSDKRSSRDYREALYKYLDQIR